MSNNIKHNIIEQHEAVEKSWERFNDNRTADWGLAGHDTGHHYLNLLIGGWMPGKLTTIGARSGVGKTAMTTQMFQGGARVLQGKRSEFLFFTWEMSPDYLVDRHISQKTGLTLKQLTQGARLLPTNTIERIKDSYADADTLPVHYQMISLDIKDVKLLTEKFVKDCKAKEKVEGVKIQPVVIIDFIGMAQFSNYGPRTYGISDFIYGCKQVATQTDATFCVFSQINRASDVKEIPSRADFSDSQAIEQASDNLILLHRPEYHGIPSIKVPSTGVEVSSENKMLVRVLKSRDMGTADMLANVDVKYYRFWANDMQWDEPYWELYENAEFWIDHFDLGSGAQLKVV